MRLIRDKSGISLMIVIFALMVFAVLGWTLAVMQSTESEANLRGFDSERALNTAESGMQWALNQLFNNSAWRTTGILHNLDYGQYNVIAQDGAVSGQVEIISTGYTPQQANYRAMRQIRLVVDLGSLINAVQTQPPDLLQPERGLFNWSQTQQGYSIAVEGDIEAGHYEGDGDGIYDELGQDYNPPPGPLLPPDAIPPVDDIRKFATSFPPIDMQYFYNTASNRWPVPSMRALTATASVINGGAAVQIGTNDFFNNNDIQEVIVRRNDIANWWLNNANWRTITGVSNQGRRAALSSAVTWPGTVSIKLVKRFYQKSYKNQNIWYIGGQIAGGTSADTIIDLTNDDIDFDGTYLVVEGNTVIKGPNRLRMRLSGPSSRYPNLATKDGNIISLDQVVNSDRRRFEGLIYSENGLIDFNYLNGTIVMGGRINFDGDIYVRYRSNRIISSGFVFKPTTINWQEQ